MALSIPQRRVRDLYGFAFPDEFFRFREFLDRLPPDTLGETCNMYPAFPFEVAAGRPPTDYPGHPLWQDRYYNDLPEFVTLFKGTTDGLHWGYFFDSPSEHPPVVAHYWHSDTIQHSIDGDTLFEATRWRVENDEVEFLEMAEDDPGEADDCEERLRQLATVRENLSAFWGADRPQTGYEYLAKFKQKTRRKPTAPTWDRLGIVVPRGQYRRLSSDPFSGHEADPQPQQVGELTAGAMRHLEAGRAGAALKLGRDLWPWGQEFPECYALLDAAYQALGRDPLRRLMAAGRSFRDHCDAQRRRDNPNRSQEA